MDLQAHGFNRMYFAYPWIAIPLQIVVTLFAVTYLLSFLGGWWSLAARYQTTRRMPAGSFLLSGNFRYVVGYQNVIRAASDAEGLYLRFWPRLAHAPLFIPWSAITLKKPGGLIFRSQTMLLGNNPAVPFTVPLRKVEKLLRHRVVQGSANGDWPRING